MPRLRGVSSQPGIKADEPLVRAASSWYVWSAGAGAGRVSSWASTAAGVAPTKSIAALGARKPNCKHQESGIEHATQHEKRLTAGTAAHRCTAGQA